MVEYGSYGLYKAYISELDMLTYEQEHHIMSVDMWNAHRNARVETDQTPDTDEAAYLRHLDWIRKEYRVIHKCAWTCSDCLDLLSSDAADGAFNNSIRR
ncbi:hypothetical protein D1007_02126 [Hordeum vulgare]|nr:hypothetical protein D1007_02126 [Hordeum vulgare]